jgi:preprotein translocase subunit Sec63
MLLLSACLLAEAQTIKGIDTFYDIFGCSQQNCTPAIIKRKYRKLAIALHPDKHNSMDREDASMRFQQLQLAYETYFFKFILVDILSFNSF